MGFKEVGKVKLSRSKKSFTISYTDPYTLLMRELFLNREDLKNLESGELTQAFVYILEPKMRVKSCESHVS